MARKAKTTLHLKGQKFGRWTVISDPENGRVDCRCDCGTERNVLVTALLRGRSHSCGCAKNWRNGAHGFEIVGDESSIYENMGLVDLMEFSRALTEEYYSRTCGCSKHVTAELLQGQRFGNLTIIGKSSVEKGEGRYTRVLCHCHLCGKDKEMTKWRILYGHQYDCGCATKKRWMRDKVIDHVGEKYNHLTILGIGSTTQKVICRCDCGKVCEKRWWSVCRGDTTSCGCEHRKSSSGMKGVFFSQGKWHATYWDKVLKRTRIIALCKTFEEACKARAAYDAAISA